MLWTGHSPGRCLAVFSGELGRQPRDLLKLLKTVCRLCNNHCLEHEKQCFPGTHCTRLGILHLPLFPSSLSPFPSRFFFLTVSIWTVQGRLTCTWPHGMVLHSGVGEGIGGSNHIPSRMGNCRLKYIQKDPPCTEGAHPGWVSRQLLWIHV